MNLQAVPPYVGSLNLEACFVRVFGKSSKERVVTIGLYAKEKIDFYIKTFRATLLKNVASPHLFVARAGKPMTRQGFWKLLRKYGQKAGIIRKIKPHSLTRISHFEKNNSIFRWLWIQSLQPRLTF